MKYPNLNEEKKLRRKGYRVVAGLDESGRGPLAGPVVAAAVCLRKNLKSGKEPFSAKLAENGSLVIKDSKKLSPKKRETLYKLLIKNPNIKWGIGRVSEKVIDKVNILEATKLAMIKAIKKLKKTTTHPPRPPTRLSAGGPLPDFLIIDGNFKLNLPIPQKSIIKADEKVFSCAAASIIAKVYRDRIMRRYHKKYSQYGFDKHKGYPTKQHRKMLKKHGPCKIHRKTFKPVKSCKHKNYLLS